MRNYPIFNYREGRKEGMILAILQSRYFRVGNHEIFLSLANMFNIARGRIIFISDINDIVIGWDYSPIFDIKRELPNSIRYTGFYRVKEG